MQQEIGQTAVDIQSKDGPIIYPYISFYCNCVKLIGFSLFAQFNPSQYSLLATLPDYHKGCYREATRLFSLFIFNICLALSNFVYAHLL